MKAPHLLLGEKGEQLATKHLLHQGFNILQRNYKFSKAEIDIIAMDKDVMVFIEVKARSYNFYGQPEEFVNSKKEALIFEAACAFMEESSFEEEIRFDIIAITYHSPKRYKLKHLKDAFFMGLS